MKSYYAEISLGGTMMNYDEEGDTIGICGLYFYLNLNLMGQV